MSSGVTAPNLVVGLNAQVDPDEQGGVQSLLLSIVDCLQSARNGIDLRVIAAARHAERIAEFTGSAEPVITWPYPEIGTITANLPGRWNSVRNLPGVHKTSFDRILKDYRKTRAGRRTSSEEQNDAILAAHGVTVLHFGYPRKFATKIPFVFEPHDLQHRHFPQYFSKDEIEWREDAYIDGCRQAAFVICGSQWTKRDIMAQFGIPRARIAVVPRSSTNASLPIAVQDIDRVADRWNLPETFAIYPATTFQHKNHIRLLQALAELRDRFRISLPLVCTGRLLRDHFPKIQREIERLNLHDLVFFLGTVSRHDLSALLQRASLMLFPSLFEGLSQTLLEGLAHNMPIVAASQTSVPETLGSAALYFDGTDVESITETLYTIMRHPEMLGEIRSRVAAQYLRYSWEEASVTLAACYKSAVGFPLTQSEQRCLRTATADDTDPHRVEQLRC